MSVEAFALRHAQGPPALLVAADGFVVATNPRATRELPAITPGVDLGGLVADRRSWHRFLTDVAVSASPVLTQITFGAPINLVCLVTGTADDGADRTDRRAVLRLLRVTPAASESTEWSDPAARLEVLLAEGDQLVASHARLEAMLDQTSTLIFVKDRAGRYLTVNREFERLRRSSREEVLGRMAEDLVDPESAARIRAEDEQVWRTGKAQTTFTTELVDGEERSYVTAKFLLAEQAGQPPVLGGISVDITERARAEWALRVASEQLSEAQRVGQLGNWERDVNSASVTASEALCELFDVPVGSGLDAFAARYHPDDEHIPTELSIRARAGGGRQRGRFRIVRADGEVRWMETTVELVGGEDAPRLVGITQDITEREEAARARDDLESRLRQAQRLESVGQLAGGIAHDFNNILSVVSLQTELLLGDLPDDAPMVEDLTRVRDAAQRAGGLTRQLLEFSRADGGTTDSFDLGAVVDTVASLLGRTLEEHIRVRVERDDDLWQAVADPTRAEQVVLNLAVNARDAMPDGGTLTLRVINQDVDAAYAAPRPGLVPGRYVELSVSDTGIGMDAEVRLRAFDPFFTTKPKGRGTGLGLASVYGIVTAAHGHIEIYSEPGIGTVVRVLLPAVATPHEAPDHPHDETSRGDGQRVLVVEDDEPVRHLVGGSLRRAGYHVETVSSYAEAVAVLDAGPPFDVLITDVVLTDLPGPRLAEEFEQRQPGAAVLFMSGYTDGLLADGTLSVGRRSFIAKPFTVDRLLSAVAGLAAQPPVAPEHRPR
jgi:PAS domain S-box-containing protein